MPTTTGRPAQRRSVGLKGHLHQVDIVRLATFACVILVHSSSFTNPAEDKPENGLEMLLHFTRESFFVITAFVLFHVYYRKSYDLRTFWSRRFYLVGVPYLVWTVIYYPNSVDWKTTSAGGAVVHFFYDVLTGAASYHLYFLLVSLQVYAIFPLFVWLIRRTEGHHLRLFLVSLALELAFMGYLAYLPWPHGPLRVIIGHSDELIWTYQLYLIVGALAAVHLPELQSWVDRHGRGILAGLVATAALAEGVYVLGLEIGWLPTIAAQVLQPVSVIWSLAVVAGLYWLGSEWAFRRREGSRASKIVLEMSLASFGIYLVHPLFLRLVVSVLRFEPAHHTLGAPLSSIITFFLVVALSVVFTEAMLRTRLAVALTGRERKERAPKVEHRARSDGEGVEILTSGAGDLPSEEPLASAAGKES